jgi:hypothetical protein
MNKSRSNVDPVSGRPLSGWQGLINRPRGEAANAAIGKTVSAGKTVVKKIEIPDGYTLVCSMPQGSLGWVMMMKRDPWM